MKNTKIFDWVFKKLTLRPKKKKSVFGTVEAILTGECLPNSKIPEFSKHFSSFFFTIPVSINVDSSVADMFPLLLGSFFLQGPKCIGVHFNEIRLYQFLL